MKHTQWQYMTRLCKYTSEYRDWCKNINFNYFIRARCHRENSGNLYQFYKFTKYSLIGFAFKPTVVFLGLFYLFLFIYYNIMPTHIQNCLKPIDNDNENDPDFNKVFHFFKSIYLFGRISDLNRLLTIANRRMDLVRACLDRLKAIV